MSLHAATVGSGGMFARESQLSPEAAAEPGGGPLVFYAVDSFVDPKADQWRQALRDSWLRTARAAGVHAAGCDVAPPKASPAARVTAAFVVPEALSSASLWPPSRRRGARVAGVASSAAARGGVSSRLPSGRLVPFNLRALLRARFSARAVFGGAIAGAIPEPCASGAAACPASPGGMSELNTTSAASGTTRFATVIAKRMGSSGMAAE